MYLVLRAVAIYLFILLVFRISGKRTLSQMTTIDFVLLLVIGEATQQALISDDNSLMGAMLVITTLIVLDVFFARFSTRSNILDKVTNGVPVIVLKNGQPVDERIHDENLEVDDILEAARRSQGLESIDQIKYAVLEKDGQISIIPKK